MAKKNKTFENKAAMQYDRLLAADADKFAVYPFENATKEQKDKLIKDFVELTAKHTMQLFMSLGLKTHIETMIVNDATGEEFIFSFRKVK